MDEKPNETTPVNPGSLYEAIFRNATAGVVLADPEGRLLEVNPTFCAMLGYSEDDLLRMNFRDFSYSEDLKTELPLLARCIHDGDSQYRIRKRYLTKGGDTIWVDITVGIIRDETGAPQNLVGTVFEITESVKAFDSLRESERQKSLILESIDEAIAYFDLDLRVLWANDKARSGALSDNANLIGRHCYEVWHQGTEPCDHCPVLPALKSGNPVSNELDTPDGSHWLLTGYPVRGDGDDTVVGLLEVAQDITEARHNEDELRLSRERLELVLDGAELGTWDRDLPTDRVRFDERWASMLGYTLDELEPDVTTWEKLIHPDDLADTLQKAELHLRGDTEIYEAEFRMRHKSGNWVWILGKGRVNKRDEQGRPLRISGTHLDITETKRVEEELRRSRELLLETGSMARVGGWEVDLERKSVYWTETTRDIHELQLTDDVDLESAYDYFPGSARKEIRNAVQRAIQQGIPYDLELPFVTAKGNRLWVRTIGKPEMVDGRCVRLMGTFQDITEQRRAQTVGSVNAGIASAVGVARSLEELIGAIRRELSRVLDTTNFYVAIYDSETGCYRFPLHIDQWDNSSPLDSKPLSGSLTDYVRRTGQPCVIRREDLAALAEKGEVWETGSECEVWLGVPLAEEDETFGVVAIQSYDDPDAYSERDRDLLMSTSGYIAMAIRKKQAEQELVAGENRYRSLIESSEGMIFSVDRNGITLTVGGRQLEQYGLSQEDIVGRPIREVLGDLADTFQEQHQIVFETGQSCEYEHQYELNGKQFHECTTLYPICDMTGEIIAVGGICRDVSEQRAAEAEKARLTEQLHQAQKMETIGRLAGGVAHDFNNKLSVILGNVEFAKMELDPDHPAFEELETIELAATHSAELTRKLLGFARKQTIAPEVFNINARVKGVTDTLRRLLSEQIVLSWVPGPDIWPVKFDLSQLDQILTNLVVNARDAIEGTGSISIRTENVTVEHDGVTSDHLPDQPGAYVMLSVSDDGSGIDSDSLPHLFDPFFTTKPLGEGTGLGLATVYGILKQNGGHISVDSEPEAGATFRVFFRRYVAAE